MKASSFFISLLFLFFFHNRKITRIDTGKPAPLHCSLLYDSSPRHLACAHCTHLTLCVLHRGLLSPDSAAEICWTGPTGLGVPCGMRTPECVSKEGPTPKSEEVTETKSGSDEKSTWRMQSGNGRKSQRMERRLR